MKRLVALLPVLCLAAGSFTARADTLTDGNNGMIGPYSMTFNPGATTLSLFCLNDTLDINTGETWSVTVVQGINLGTNSLTMGNATLFEEEAYILSQLGLANPLMGINTDTVVQDALWEVFDTGTANTTADSQALYAAAIGSSGASFISHGDYDDYLFYIYNGGSITGRNDGDADSKPQNFIGPPPPESAPEPSSLFLLGSALIGLAGIARRKLLRG